jgi:hypothetical protein
MLGIDATGLHQHRIGNNCRIVFSYDVQGEAPEARSKTHRLMEKVGEHCLSEASCPAFGFGKHRMGQVLIDDGILNETKDLAGS